MFLNDNYGTSLSLRQVSKYSMYNQINKYFESIQQNTNEGCEKVLA